MPGGDDDVPTSASPGCRAAGGAAANVTLAHLRARARQQIVGSHRPDVLPRHPCAATCSQTLEITTDPSPTELATRFTDPARTSPTAKTPGTDVA